MNKLYALLLVLVFSLGTACTQQQCAKSYGGKVKIELPCGKKLTFATWKESNLWYAYRDMRPGEKPENTTLKESSNYGTLEGTVTFVECAP